MALFLAGLALAPGPRETLGGLSIVLVHRAIVREAEEISTVIERLRAEISAWTAGI